MQKRADSNASVKVSEYLKDAIIRGAYSPGEGLNEREVGKTEGKPHEIMEKRIDQSRLGFLAYYRQFGFGMNTSGQ